MTKILVVDDEPSIVDTLREILTWEGYEVSAAAEGKEALELLTTTTPDIILIDYMLPWLDGVQVLTQMRRLPGCADIPAILMSAVAEPPARSHLWVAFLKKPFNVQSLLDALDKALAGRARTK